MSIALGLPVTGRAQTSSPPTVKVSVNGMHIAVEAVDPNVFHIVAYPSGLPSPPLSPFVVENVPLLSAKTEHENGSILVRTTAASCEIASTGTFTIRAAGGRVICSDCQIATNSDNTTISLGHASDGRLYGAGNAGMNTSGDLVHPSGTQINANGCTRIPFLWSTDGYGVLIANDESGISWSDTSDALNWQIHGTYVDLYILVAPHGGYGLLNAYSRLTGRAPIPPRWTFGYMQSRWGYADAADVQDKWHQFRSRDIPVDAFIYDYDWFQNDWDFNPNTFPPGSLDAMKKLGLHFVGIRKPRVNGAHLDFAIKQGWVNQSDNGTDLHFDLPAARYWWWSHQAPLYDAGVDGWWNDEAERTNDEFFQMCSTEWNGMTAMSPKRVWTISRSFSPGMQRFGASVWSGDITSTWSTLANQPGTMLNFSLAGMPYCAQDLGGFIGPPTPELYARWIEEGVFIPVMRAHGMFNQDRWPWAFGVDVLAAAKQAIELRYRLIPYLYSCAEKTSKTGAPIMRPLFFNYPNDKNTYNLQNEWLVGSSILAAPILSQGGTRTIYLPAGQWYDFNTNEPLLGGQTVAITNAPLALIPAYVPAGAILPLGPVLQYTGQGPEDPLEVRVYPGASGKFSLYEDNGSDYSYLNGQYSSIKFIWNDETKKFTVATRIGSFPSMLNERHFTVRLPDGRSRSIVYDGTAVSIKF